MDHARKIGKSNTPILWSHKPSPPSSARGRAASMDEETREDRRLVNWHKWLKDREKHYRHYEKRCARDRDDLLMIKDLDDFRRKDETENIIECAGVRSLAPTDERRNPAFWVTPEFLPKRGHPDWPDIAVTLTSNRTNAKSTMERVALPELIKREKGLPISRDPKVSKTTDCSREPEKTLSRRRMKALKAEELDINQLAIKGEKWEPKARKKVPKILITSSETLKTLKSNDGSQSEVIEHDADDRGIVLMIQDREVTSNKRVSLEESDELSSDRLRWSLIFKSTNMHACMREIRFENRGNCAIIYRWRCDIQDTSFLPALPHKSPFFFNKNKGLVLPGQVVNLPVWFRSHVPRVATELWTLKTEPPICQESLNFRFWGIATLSSRLHSNPHESPMNTKSTNPAGCESIEKYLGRRIRDAKIHEIVASIVDNVHQKVSPTVPYDSLFVESEIFNAKNPTYFWHSEVIRELKNIYDDATSDDSPPWSLSLIDLRTILLEIKEAEVRSEALLRFNELCRESLTSSLLERTGCDDKSVVYNLLCSFANKFEEESDYTANVCSLVEIPTARISGEAPGDISRSTSITSSQISLSTPRKKPRKKSRFGRSKTTSKASFSMSTSNRDIIENTLDEKITKSCLLYKEVFYVRIREIFSNTILAICAAVDSNSNVNPLKK